jgi:hypothetical protein
MEVAYVRREGVGYAHSQAEIERGQNFLLE